MSQHSDRIYKIIKDGRKLADRLEEEQRPNDATKIRKLAKHLQRYIVVEEQE